MAIKSFREQKFRKKDGLPYGYNREKVEQKIQAKYNYSNPTGFEEDEELDELAELRKARNDASMQRLINSREYQDKQRQMRESAIELAKSKSNAGNDRTTAIRIPEAKKDYSGLGYLPTYRGMNEAANGADVDPSRYMTDAIAQTPTVSEEESFRNAEKKVNKYLEDDELKGILNNYARVSYAQDMAESTSGLKLYKPLNKLLFGNELDKYKQQFIEKTGVSEEEFDDIAEHYNYYANAKANKAMEQNIDDMSLASKLAMSPLVALEDVTGNALGILAAERSKTDAEDLGRDYNSAAFGFKNLGNAFKKSVNKDISGYYDEEGNRVEGIVDEEKHPLLNEIATHAYEIPIMTGESVISAMYPGNVGTAMYASGAYADSLRENENRGLTEEQATKHAAIMGTAEYIFERTPLAHLGELLTKGVGKQSIKSFIKRQMREEGREELGGNVVDVIADAFISGDKSKLNQTIALYQSQEWADEYNNGIPLTKEEATIRAWKEWGLNTLDEYVTAALSAGLSVGLATGPSYLAETYSKTKAGRNIANYENKTGNLTRNVENENYISDSRKNYVADQDYEQAQQTRQAILAASEKAAKNERISGREARALAESYATTAENIDTARRARAVEQIERRQEAAKEVALKSIENTTSIEELETIKERNARDEAVVAAVEEKEAQMIEQGATTKEEIENVITPRKAFETAKEGNVIEEEKLESLPVETKLAYQYGKEAANDIKGSDLSDVDISSIENKNAKPGKRVQKIKDVKVNQRNELVFTTEDGTEINAYEANYTDKGKQVYKGENGILSLNKPSLVRIAMEAVEQGNYTGAISNLTTAIRTMDTLGRTQGINFEDALKSYGYMQDAVGKDILEEAFNANKEESNVFDEAKKVGRVRKSNRGLIREQTAENEAEYTSQFGNKDIEALLKKEHIAYSADNTEEAIRSFEDLSDAQKDFLDSFSSRTGVDFDFIFTKEGGIRGTYAPSTGKIILNLAYSNNMFEVALHEGIGEFLQAHNAKAYNAISESILNYYASTQADKLAEKIRNYQRTYKNLKYRESANELVNDALGQIFSTEEGLKELTRWLDENETEAQSKRVKKTFLDYFNDLKNMIKDIKSKGGLKEGDAKALTMAEKDAAKFAKQLTAAMNEAITTRDAQAEITGVAEEGNSQRLSIEMDQRGKYFVNIQEDIISNLTSNKEIKDYVNEYIKEYYPSIDLWGFDIPVIRKSRNEFLESKYTKKIRSKLHDLFLDKMRIAANLDEIVNAADHYKWEAPKHTRTDNIIGFIRGKVQVRVGQNDYIADVLLANDSNVGLIFYDIIDLTPTTIKAAGMSPMVSKANTVKNPTASNNNLPSVKNIATPKRQKSAVSQNKGGGKSLDIRPNLSGNEIRYIEKEIRNNAQTIFKTKDGNIGVRNNRTIYIVSKADDLNTNFIPERIYDVDFNEENPDETAIVMEGIEDYEQGKADPRLTEEQFIESRIRLRSKNVRPTGSIRIYGIRNGGRFRELVIRKSGQILWRDGTDIRVEKNRKTDFDSFTKYDSSPGKGTKLADYRFSFAGLASDTADMEAVTEADKMRSEGKSMEEIFAKTGWYLGNDDKWRYEISNKDARLYLDGDALLADTDEHKHYRELVDYINSSKDMGEEWMKAFDEVGKYIDKHKIGSNKKEYRLEEILKHDELFEAYPSLRRVKIVIADLPAGTNGRFNPKTNTIELSENLKRVGQNPLKRTLFHELQHAIQQLEGFAHGSSPEFWNLRGLPQYTKEEDIKAYEDAKKKVDDLRETLPEDFLKKYDKYTSLMHKYAGESTNLDLYESAQRLYKLLQDEDKAALDELDDAYWELDFAFPTPSEMLASEAYYATAGEIEAREVADRIDMTEEERRANLPKMTDESGRVVFAENATTPWRYPTGDDFRFSKAVFGEESQYSSQIEQTQFVSQILSTLNNQLKGTSVSMPYINDTVKYILDKYQADLNPDEFTMELAQFIAYMTAHEQVDYNQMMNYLLNIGDEVIQASNLKDPEEVRIYSELKKELSSHKINLTDLERKELISKFGGSWNAVFGKLNEVGIKLNKAGQHMDGSTYSEIVDKFREIAGVQLDEEKGAVDQIATIIDAMDALKPSAYKWEGATDMDKALDVATTIIDRYYSMATSIKESNIVKGTEKGAAAVERAKQQEIKKLRAKQQEYKAKVNEEFQQLVEDRKKVIEDQQAFYKRQAEVERLFEGEKKDFYRKKAITDKEIEKTARIQAMMQYQGIKETEAKKKNKDNIVRTCMRLINWMDKPTDTRHVPTFLKPALLDMIKSINFMPASMRKGDDGTISAIKWQESMKMLQQVIQSIENADAENMNDADKYELSLVMEVDVIVDKMQQLLNKYSGTADVSRMKAEDLKTLSEIMTSISRSISKMNENFMNRRFKHVSDAAVTSMKEMGDLKPISNTMGVVKSYASDFLNLDMAEPTTFFEELGSASESIMQEFFDGEKIGIQIIEEADEFFGKLGRELNLTTKDIRAWEEDVKDYTYGGVTISLTSADLMSLYCSYNREMLDQEKRPFEATHHIAAGGIKGFRHRVKYKEVNRNPQVAHVSQGDVVRLLDNLSETQKKYADAVVAYMSTTLAAHGNETSNKLNGYSKFLGQYYFPLKTDNNAIATTESNNTSDLAAFRRLIFPSFTKSQVDKADNALVIMNFFDVVTEHITGMSNYCAYAMPISDAMRWYNYAETERANTDEENQYQRYTTSVKGSMDRVRGDEARKYFENFIRDVNLDNKPSGSKAARIISQGLTGFAKAKAVGLNIRVIAQQPCAIIRASDVIEGKYLAEGWVKMSKNPKAATEYAQSENYLCYWKSKGFSDTRVSQSMKEIITGLGSVRQDLVEKTGVVAGLADDITWASMYYAAEAKIRDTTDLQEGTKEFKTAVEDLFSDIINHTQVIDSQLRKTGTMRSKSEIEILANAFKKEPQKSYNMLHRAYWQVYQHPESESAKKNWKKTLTIFIENAFVTAIAQSIVDAWRDDDEEDSYLIKILKKMLPYESMETIKDFADKILASEDLKLRDVLNLMQGIYGGAGNILDNANIASSIPFVADIDSLLKGYSVTRLDSTSVLTQIQRTITVFSSTTATRYNMIYSLAQLVGYATGIGVDNALRDLRGIYNQFISGYTGVRIEKNKTAEEKNKKTKESNRLKEVFATNDLTSMKAEITNTYNNALQSGKSEADAWKASRDMLKEQYLVMIAEHPEDKAAINNRFKTLLKYTKQSDGKGGYREPTEKEISNKIESWINAAE